MSTLELRRAAHETLENLPPGKMKVAAEFLAYLENYASNEATAELLKIPNILRDLKEARKEYAAGKGVNWRGVRKDV
jgi:hypothetical protein